MTKMRVTKSDRLIVFLKRILLTLIGLAKSRKSGVYKENRDVENFIHELPVYKKTIPVVCTRKFSADLNNPSFNVFRIAD